jgi:hypothetical protein
VTGEGALPGVGGGGEHCQRVEPVAEDALDPVGNRLGRQRPPLTPVAPEEEGGRAEDPGEVESGVEVGGLGGALPKEGGAHQRVAPGAGGPPAAGGMNQVVPREPGGPHHVHRARPLEPR